MHAATYVCVITTQPTTMSMGNNVQVCLSGTSMNQRLVVVTQCLK